MSHNLLVVDDDPQVLETAGQLLKLAGYLVHEARSMREALRVVHQDRPDAVVLDHDLPDGSGLDIIRALREAGNKTPIVVLTGHASYDLAVAAIKAGADNFLPKPLHGQALLVMLQRLLAQRREERRHTAAARTRKTGQLDPFIGTSRAIQELSDLAHAVLHSHAPVLILGETGTGKSVLARWLHERGPRADAAYVDLNCAGLTKELAESELFGHRRGAFTGASSDKNGLLELAHEGTLFLDEIGDLEPSVQPKLLKVLEDRRYRRLGEVQTREADVRLISATHRDLGKMANAGSFRNDLLFRINTITFELPSLRTRKEDIVPIATDMLERIAADQGKPGVRLSAEACDALTRYSWPGNVRELRNTLERALIFCRGEVLELATLRFTPLLTGGIAAPHEPSSEPAENLPLDEVERRHILSTLEAVGGKVEQAAQRLGIARSSLYAKLKRYGVAAG